MTELERLGRERLERNAFMKHNHMELESVKPDKAVIRLTVTPDVLNPIGTVHGGAYYTMADCAAGTCAFTDFRTYVTQSSDVHFLRTVDKGQVFATATVMRRGRTVTLIHVDVTDEQDNVLMTGTYTFFCVDQRKAANIH